MSVHASPRPGDHSPDPVAVVLAGAGAFGRSLLARARALPWLRFVAVVEPDPAAAETARALLSDPSIPVIPSVEGLDREADVFVEATGDAEAAAGHALAALALGQHLVLVSKELDVMVGPELAARFAERGLVCTPVDGDQPSLLLQLVYWARTLGLEVLCAGKASEYDFVMDHGPVLNWRDRRVDGAALAASLAAGRALPAVNRLSSRHRAVAAAGLPRRTVADLCEMGVVANFAGLTPDRPDFHAPLAHPTELADLFQPASAGGLLGGSGRIDVFNALRRADEMSFAGGVFVTVATDDEATWSLLAEKGHVVSAGGGAALIANPRHLLGVEAPMNILRAARDGIGAIPGSPLPRVALVGLAVRDLAAGDTLEITDAHHHEIGALRGVLVPASEARDSLPYYACVRRRLARPVPAGQALRAADFDDEPPRRLTELLEAQSSRFEG